MYRIFVATVSVIQAQKEEPVAIPPITKPMEKSEQPAQPQDSVLCPMCGKQIPKMNYALHEIRCKKMGVSVDSGTKDCRSKSAPSKKKKERLVKLYRCIDV